MKNLLKKPVFWILLVANVLCIGLVVYFFLVPALCEHFYIETVTLAATCTDEGEKTFACEKCVYSYKEPMARLSHTYDDGTVIKKPTCTSEGKKEFVCSCGAAKQENIPMEAHRFDELTVEKEPNCTETGEKTGICLDCDQKLVAEVLPVNDAHDLQQTVTKAATCAEEGQATNTCTRCGHSETVTLEKLKHDWKVGMELPATCTTQGDRQEICKICGKEQWYKTPVDPYAHHWISMGFYFGTRCMWCNKDKDDL